MGAGHLYEGAAPTLTGEEHTICEAVDRDRLWETVEAFAGLTRVSGSADERRAAEHIRDRLTAAGVTHERFEPELYLSTPRDATIRSVDGTVTLESAKTVAFGGDGRASGDVLRLTPDAGGDSVESLLEQSLGIEDESVAGKVVVAESLIPIAAIRRLDEREAAAFVAIHPHEREPHEGIVSPVWGTPTYDTRAAIPDLPVANVSGADGARLDKRIEERGSLELVVECAVDTGWERAPVVVAEIEAGTDTDEFVLMHGHYDSWHVGVTDNATGDAALLESARVLEAHADELARNVRVAWWPGHSTGRYAGSTWYVDEHAAEFDRYCLAHVNVDSPGVADAVEYVSRVKWMTAAEPVAESTIEDVAGKETRTRRPSRAGDYSLNNVGVPGLSLQSSIPADEREERGYHLVGGSGGHADAWHLSTDTLEKADPDVLRRDTQVYLLAVYRLAARERPPLDYRRTVDEHRETLAGRAEAAAALSLEAEFDALRAEYRRLADALETLYDGEYEFDDLRPVARTLTRVNYVTGGRFEQDPAVGRRALPGMAVLDELPKEDPKRRFAAVGVRRTINRYRHELRELLDELPS